MIEYVFLGIYTELRCHSHIFAVFQECHAAFLYILGVSFSKIAVSANHKINIGVILHIFVIARECHFIYQGVSFSKIAVSANLKINIGVTIYMFVIARECHFIYQVDFYAICRKHFCVVRECHFCFVYHVDDNIEIVFTIQTDFLFFFK